MNKQLCHEANELLTTLDTRYRAMLAYNAQTDTTYQQRLYMLRQRAFMRLSRRLGVNPSISTVTLDAL